MGKGYEIHEGVIVISRVLSELDVFLKDFLKILVKHSDYLVVSGFVSISTGRTRGTEDIDVLAEKLEFEGFEKLFNELKEKEFWCYQGDSAKEAYEYFKDMTNIRFARKNQLFPNIELIPVDESRKAKYYEFTHPQMIKIQDFEFKIPQIEFEILYKEIVLAGKKDLEDARHLRMFFKDILSEERFKACREVILEEIK